MSKQAIGSDRNPATAAIGTDPERRVFMPGDEANYGIALPTSSGNPRTSRASSRGISEHQPRCRDVLHQAIGANLLSVVPRAISHGASMTYGIDAHGWYERCSSIGRYRACRVNHMGEVGMKRASIVGLVLTIVSGTAFAAPVNVALGASVTLNGTYGQLRAPGSGGWSELPVADPSTLTDGVYRPVATDWNNGSVWWDSFATNSANNSIEVSLGSLQTIIGLAAQADDNDTYRIEYWDGASWVTAWDIPAVGGYGLQARPNRLDPSEIYMLAGPVSTDRLRFTATGGDGYYGVSEIQAFAAVPEPGTLGLLGVALAGVAASLRRRRT